MKKSNLKFVLLGLSVLILGFIFIGCGQQTSSTYSQPAGNYTISGTVSKVTSSSIHSMAVSDVTNIVAIGADCVKYKADYNSTTGVFSVKVVKGLPYALGFYSQSGGKITLLGYLKQNEVNWDSLPTMSVTSDAMALGTLEVNAASVEAIPSTSLQDLMTESNMDLATANLYGKIDDPMAMLTNIDVNGNGVFDMDEGKAYMLQIVMGTDMGGVGGILSGEVTKMLNQFNETYSPSTTAYQIIFHAIDSANPADGTIGKMKFPTTIYGANGIGKTELNAEVWGASSGHVWNFSSTATMESLAQASLTTPEVIPTGSYTFEVTGKGTYTFQNVQGSQLCAVGTTEGIIFPVFKMVTNEAGLVTSIEYKWKVKRDGVVSDATAAEVKATIVDTAMNSNNGNLIDPSPSLGVVLGSYPSTSSDPALYRAPLKIDRDSNSINTTSWNVNFNDIAMFSSSYKINSNVSLQFMFGK